MIVEVVSAASSCTLQMFQFAHACCQSSNYLSVRFRSRSRAGKLRACRIPAPLFTAARFRAAFFFSRKLIGLAKRIFCLRMHYPNLKQEVCTFQPVKFSEKVLWHKSLCAAPAHTSNGMRCSSRGWAFLAFGADSQNLSF